MAHDLHGLCSPKGSRCFSGWWLMYPSEKSWTSSVGMMTLWGEHHIIYEKIWGMIIMIHMMTFPILMEKYEKITPPTSFAGPWLLNFQLWRFAIERRPGQGKRTRSSTYLGHGNRISSEKKKQFSPTNMGLKVDTAAYNNFARKVICRTGCEPEPLKKKKGTGPNRAYQKREKPNRMFAVLGGVTKQLAV